MVSRRSLLQSAIGMSALMMLNGCQRTLVRPPSCDHFSSPDAMPVVDAHCHIFNATDLQVAGFINQVKFKLPDTSPLNIIGHLVQSLGWAYAPTANDELKWLNGRERDKEPKVLSGLPNEGALLSTVHGMGKTTDERYAEFWNEVARREPERAILFADQLATLRNTYAPLTSTRTMQGRMILSQLRSVDGIQAYIQEEQAYAQGGITIVSFLKTFFRFRMENAWTMLQTYGCDSAPSLDVLCPALVDYDLWLGDQDHGNDSGRTRSHLVDQLAVMAEISLATEGRVKAMAPFNPLRAACVGGEQYVALSRQAIERYGCVAYKLYPPMGFSAVGNAGGEAADIPLPSCGKGTSKVSRARLDEVLGQFFDYCSENDVPVMAHAAPSNAAYDGAEKLAAPKFWRELMGSHAESLLRGRSRARISLGHMGGDRDLDTTNEWRNEIVSLIEDYPEHVYADLGYYEHVLGDGTDRRKLAVQLAALSKEAVSSRVMYGSDWSMLAAQPKAHNYLNAMGQFLESDLRISQSAQKAILGENAKKFFGFSSGTPSWKRIEIFHEKGGRSMDALRKSLVIS
jgi:predicted TIM-barrel fold metal-dependent hydrolase